MDVITVDWNMLDDMSYRTKLGKSLKNTLRKFNKEELFDEINNVITHFIEVQDSIPNEHRVKSIQSCSMKYDKHYPSIEVEKTFNDILGLRIIIDNYDLIDNMILPTEVEIADMRKGKAVDDGYRAVHMYYQKDHFYYPIEIQFMTSKDRLFNEWLHIFLYKYVEDKNVGKQLRKLYDNGIIKDEETFRKEMKNICAIS